MLLVYRHQFFTPIACRDRFGIAALLHTNFEFRPLASEVRAIVRSRLVPVEPEPEAAVRFRSLVFNSYH